MTTSVEYAFFKNKQNKRLAAENEAKMKAEEKAISIQQLSEQETIKRAQEAKQESIYNICKPIQTMYYDMVNCGTEMRRNENLFNEKEGILANFLDTKEERLREVNNVDDSLYHQMRDRRMLFIILPILDATLAVGAVYPIVTSLFADLGLSVIAGLIASFAVGLGLCMIGRWIMAISDANNSPVIAYCVPFILPFAYIASEVVFKGGETWSYTAVFATTSCIIQWIMVSGYKKHTEALDYLDKYKMMKNYVSQIELEERGIKNELNSLSNKPQELINKFRELFNNFNSSFLNLIIARNNYRDTYHQEPNIPLSQLTIYLGDILNIRNENNGIPLYRNEAGEIEFIGEVHGFPNCRFASDINLNDFVSINYMLNESGIQDVNLTETINAVNAIEQVRDADNNNEEPIALPTPEDVEAEAEADDNNRGLW